MKFPLQKYPMFQGQTEPSYQNCPLIHSRAVSNGWGSFKDFLANDESTTLWNLPQQITGKSSYLPTSSSTSLFFILQNVPVDAISKSKFQAVLFSGFQLPSSLPFLQVKLISCWDPSYFILGGTVLACPSCPFQGTSHHQDVYVFSNEGISKKKHICEKKNSFATIAGNGDNPKHIYNCDVVEKKTAKTKHEVVPSMRFVALETPKKAFGWDPLSHLNKLCDTKIHAHTSI